MAEENKAFADWVKIPVVVQHQFFELATKEAEAAKRKLLADAIKIEKLGKHLKFSEAPRSDAWRDWTIACVDGSDSPMLSERIGARYGTYAAGYMTFEQGALKEEDFKSGYISHQQVGDPDVTKKVLDLLMVKLEREIALDLAPHVDVVLIDGSFFGWRTGCSQIRGEAISVEGYKTAGELINHIRDTTLQLLETRKAVGVIKRVRTAALDGWVAYTQSERNCIDRNDRAILGRLMTPSTWFAYHWLFENPEAYNYYTYIRRVLRENPHLDKASIMRKAKERYEGSVASDLNCNPDKFKTARYYHRTTSAAPPFSFEIRKDMPHLETLPAYFQAPENYNTATGLPFPIDLIDQNVSLPAGFTKEFVEEIEAQLVRDPTLNKFDLANSFGRLNPQKEE